MDKARSHFEIISFKQREIISCSFDQTDVSLAIPPTGPAMAPFFKEGRPAWKANCRWQLNRVKHVLFVGRSSFHEISFDRMNKSFSTISRVCQWLVYYDVVVGWWPTTQFIKASCYAFHLEEAKKKASNNNTNNNVVDLFAFSFDFFLLPFLSEGLSNNTLHKCCHHCRTCAGVYPVPLYASLASLLLLPLFFFVPCSVSSSSLCASWNLSIIRQPRRKKLHTIFFA